ncbi:alpha/beta fold hydrolase [Puerhibacterium puerhi]|uniref:alpha/beta fold hydrolase n=1 Tax=Puerhibacterium puerhi TaxID=2692623 RepID=UPI001359DB46|nr:alpha/beta fold hydrolase [Puerhibacterium puerhi]
MPDGSSAPSPAPSPTSPTGRAGPVQSAAAAPGGPLTALLEDAFARFTGHVAVRSGGRATTYRQLDERSRAVAAAVQAHAGTSADPRPVAVLAPYDADVVAAVVGLVRAGRPCVILDPAVPASRMRQVVTLAQTPLVLTVEALADVARDVAQGADVVRLEDVEDVEDRAAAPGPVDGSTLAAVVFTSGSSGRPKGVLWSHALVAADCDVMADGFGYTADDRVALSLPVAFAAGFNVMFAALSRGCCLELLDPRATGGHRYARWLAEVGATVVHLTPSLLRGMAAAADTAVPSLRLVTLVGEAAYGTDVRAARELSAGRARVLQWLGSSETGTVTLWSVGPEEPAPTGLLPAGVATPGRTLRVVGPDGSARPAGEPGELVVTSPHHADGYWADPAGTARKFVPRDDGTWDVRMGDVAAVGADGVVRLLGRAEAAVKVRGYLVDPSEIEAALLELDEVAEAVVVARQEDTGTVLAAYVAPRSGRRTPSVARLREHVAGRLPSWMIPRHVVLVAALPRNDRGKIDRQNLPPVPPRTVVPAVGEREAALAALWAGVLGTDEVGRTDDFFALGGDSLSGEEMLQRVEDSTGVRLAASDLVRASRLDAFAALVDARAAGEGHAVGGAGAAATVPAGRTTGRAPATLRLRETGSGRAVVCLPGAGSSSIAFAHLAARLPQDHSLYVLQTRGYERRGLVESSVRSVVAHRLAELRRLRPHGPYLLVGHSLGGVVAAAMARRLAAAGHDVAVVLLDPLLAATAAGRTTPGLPPLREALSPEITPEQAATLDPWHVRRIRLVRAAVVPVAGLLPMSTAQRDRVMFTHGGLIARRHHPAPWAGPTLAYRTADNRDPEALWDALVPHRVVDRRFPCEHNSLLRPPYVDEIAADVAAFLEA